MLPLLLFSGLEAKRASGMLKTTPMLMKSLKFVGSRCCNVVSIKIMEFSFRTESTKIVSPLKELESRVLCVSGLQFGKLR
jgi:hypothetical protein